MSDKAAITINLPREEVERRWTSSAPEIDGDVTFKDAPGDRGTEIHVDLEGARRRQARRGRRSSAARRRWRRSRTSCGASSSASRRARSRARTASPEGERAERKLKQRPAQPLDDAELEKAGVR